MKATKTLLSIAVIAALPFTAMAENISGAMYTAPTAANTTHPAPTTDANAPYGRIDIDTADQEHIATTAYVKGAYNSAIAAVNKVDSNKQEKLIDPDTGNNISPELFSTIIVSDMSVQFSDPSYYSSDLVSGLNSYKQATGNDAFNTLITAGGALIGMKEMTNGLNNSIEDKISNQRVTIYTTWDDDSANATTQVTLSSAQ